MGILPKCRSLLVFLLGTHQRVTPDIKWSLLLTREPFVYDSATIPFLWKETPAGVLSFHRERMERNSAYAVSAV
jgi:hypothetical protein